MKHVTVNGGAGVFTLSVEEHAVLIDGGAISISESDEKGDYVITLKKRCVRRPYLVVGLDTEFSAEVRTNTIHRAVQLALKSPIVSWHGRDKEHGQRIRVADGKMYAVRRKL